MSKYRDIKTEAEFLVFLDSISVRFAHADQLSHREFIQLSEDVDACAEIRYRIKMQREEDMYGHWPSMEELYLTDWERECRAALDRG